MSDSLYSLAGILLTFQFAPLIVGAVYLWLAYRVGVLDTTKKTGAILFFFGGLQLFSFFMPVPDKFHKMLINQHESLIDNGAITQDYLNAVDKTCQNGNLKAYEYRAINKKMAASIHAHVEKNGMYTVEQKDTYADNFCHYVASKSKSLTNGDENE